MISLGREPQGNDPAENMEPQRGDRCSRFHLRLTPQAGICRPSGACRLFTIPFLGLTPQAMRLSRLRRSFLKRSSRAPSPKPVVLP